MRIQGSKLSYTAQREAMSRFVHRFTKEHVPQWSKKPMPNGKPYPVHFDSDKDWLENTMFHVTAKGNLSKRHSFCESKPTFPDNPEYRH